jgi:hypothetical protein
VRPRRILTAALAALLSLGTLGALTPAHAEDPGTVVLSFVDAHGRPVLGAAVLFAEDGSIGPSSAAPAASRITLTGVAPGRYGVLGETAWAGLTCLGVGPCDTRVLSSPHVSSPSLAVESGSTTVFTIRVAEPRVVTASKAPGTTLRVSMPAGYAPLATALLTSAHLPTGNIAPSVSWLRNGRVVGTGVTYRTTAADGGSSVSARLVYNPLVRRAITTTSDPAYFTGVAPVTTDAVSLARVSTSTRLTLPRRGKAHHRIAGKVVVTSSTGRARGWARVTVGRKHVRVHVVRGVGHFRLPKLDRGRYRVRATWLGTPSVVPSTSAARVLRVR